MGAIICCGKYISLEVLEFVYGSIRLLNVKSVNLRIFVYTKHCTELREVLVKYNVESLALCIGTSNGIVGIFSNVEIWCC
jgi:hypothetical protein